MNVRWVVQTNLGKHYSGDIENACKSLGLEFVPAQAIPFSDEIPNVGTDKLTTFYGATRWINNIYESRRWNPGVFFNPDSIFTTWANKYQHHTLNHGAKITTLDDLKAEIDDGQYWEDHLLFVRPVSDNKEFAGQVISAYGIWEWAENVQTDVPDFGKIPIVVTEPVGISHEWRLFMVDGKVSSGSHYREHHRFKEDAKVPDRVISFAEEMAKLYSPTPVFVMDICESADTLYVLEIGCFHSAGFYASNVEKIVHDVSDYIERSYDV